MALDLTNCKFGRLLVVRRYEHDYITPSSQKHTPKWVCLCECGHTMITTTTQLRSGKTQSCGCLQQERASSTHMRHGGRFDRLHSIWANMKTRCYNPKYSEYSHYGGRGISVCDEWEEYQNFKDWALSVGYDDSSERGIMTIDRIDVNKGYSPDNCRFVNMFIQANNKQNNIRYEIDGKKMTLSEWARNLQIDYNYLYYRVRTKGMPLKDVVNAVQQHTGSNSQNRTSDSRYLSVSKQTVSKNTRN